MRQWLRSWQAYGLLVAAFLVGESAPQWMGSVLAYGPSTSLPKGYYVRAWPSRPLQAGDLVVLDVPDVMRPYLPPQVPAHRLLKQVGGVAGADVCWESEAMTVEGRRYPYHEAIPLRHVLGCQVLGADEMVIVGSHAHSFDSRYTGVVSMRLVQWRAWPLWTWRGEE